jgi:hypothetical protein
MEPVGHMRDCRSGYWLYFYYHGFLSAFSLAVLLQMGRCHYLFDMCSIISRITYLFKIDEKRVNITSENRI